MVVGIVAVLLLRPTYAFIAFLATVIFWPSYYGASVGTVFIPAFRAVVAVLLLKCLLHSSVRRRFTWGALDTWVTIYVAVTIVIVCVTRPLGEALENRAGFLVDTWFSYMATRLCIADYRSLQTLSKWLSFLLIPLALFGIAEATTGWQPFEVYGGERYGFRRAMGPFSHSICFGMCFAMFLPLIWRLRKEKGNYSPFVYPLSGLVLLGCLSSMSSGPWVMCAAVIFCLVLERYKGAVKPVLISFALSCIFIATASNRPFYHVLASYANPLGGDSYHRAKLIECAIRFFDEWWLVGYRDQDPGWGPYLGGLGYTDVTNEFVFAGVQYGFLGVLGLCGVLVVAIRGLVRLHGATQSARLKSLTWALGSILTSLIVTFFSVSLFGQNLTLFYVVLGAVGSAHGFTRVSGATEKSRQLYLRSLHGA